MAGTADVDVQDGTGTADGNNSASNDNGPNGETPSLGVSIDLSSLFRPPTRPANPPLPSTFTLAGDPFTQPVGPKKTLPPEARPIDFFQQIFDDSLLHRIVYETNLYAEQKGKYAKTWYDLTVPELKAFLGACILMGITRMPRATQYWLKSDIFGVFPVITGALVRDRFMDILWTLHFNDNEKAAPRGSSEYDKLYKVNPLVDKLSKNFLALYNPHRENSIDEAMVIYKGQSSLKQYMPKKPIKRGFKVWCRCDSKNGYTCSFQVYTGKIGNTTEKNLGARVVKDLSAPIKGKGYHLYFDNFFSSPRLLADLVAEEIYCVGTVVTNRKEFPKFGKACINALGRGDHLEKQVIGDAVHCFVWRDRKPVAFVDTICDPSETTVVSRKLSDGNHADFTCPVAVKLYNQNMGGVDLADQLRKAYTCSRKSKSRWYMCLFWFFYDVAIQNSYILFCESPNHDLPRYISGRSKYTHLEYRRDLAKQLIATFTNRKHVGRPKKRPSKSSVHYPKRFDCARDCVHCSTTEKRVRPSTGCETCNLHMCIDCFKPYHIKHKLT